MKYKFSRYMRYFAAFMLFAAIAVSASLSALGASATQGADILCFGQRFGSDSFLASRNSYAGLEVLCGGMPFGVKFSTDGVLIVAIYPGHEEGRAEGEALAEYFETLNRYQYCSSLFRILNSPSAPYFFIIEKRDDRPVRHPGRAAKNAKRAERLAAQINAASKQLSENEEK